MVSYQWYITEAICLFFPFFAFYFSRAGQLKHVGGQNRWRINRWNESQDEKDGPRCS